MDLQDAMWYSDDDLPQANTQAETTALVQPSTSSSEIPPTTTNNLGSSQQPRQLCRLDSEQAVDMFLQQLQWCPLFLDIIEFEWKAHYSNIN